VSDEILNELVDEFGTGILSSSHPQSLLSIRQCQILLNKYGFEKAKVMVQRWHKIYNVSAPK
jgi:hypothetical protein